MVKTSVPIVQNGDPVLRSKAREVAPTEFNTPALKKILANMVSALNDCDDGVAIAAPQIGVAKRIFVVSHRAFTIEANKDDEEIPAIGTFTDKVFINPEIIKVSRKRVWVPEGCLSVRWLYGNVPRHEKVLVRALDEHGKQFTYGASGLMAQIFQHETDHLNGVLFIDTAEDIEEIPPEKMEALTKEKDTKK